MKRSTLQQIRNPVLKKYFTVKNSFINIHQLNFHYFYSLLNFNQMKQVNKFFRLGLIMSAMVIASFSVSGQTTVGPFTFYPTNLGGTIQGQAQIDGVPAVAGDIVAAFDPSNECVGAAALIINSGLAYINFVIYGDDGDGHGMSPGEDFYLKLYVASSGDIIEYGAGLSGWSNTNFAPMPGYNNPSTIYNFQSAVVVVPPTVSTASVTGITALTATGGGNVTNDGGATVTSRGVCWNTTGNPTTANSKTIDGAGTGSFTSQMTGLSPSTTYYVRAYATNSAGTAYGSQQIFTTLDLDQYFTPVWTTPFQPMNIYVLKATIDDLNMDAGDEIGIFDIDPDNGQQICVGSGKLVAPLTSSNFLVIVVSMNDNTGATNGFQSGNQIIYKLWSPGTGEVDMVTATYPYPGYAEVFTPLGSAFVELDGITVKTQDIHMAAGWNLVSFRVIPDNLDMLSIFDSLITSDRLEKIIDQDGKTVEHLPFPPPSGQWSNTIGDLTMTQGYYAKVSQNSTLTITAPPVDIPFTISLRDGWNIISVPCEIAQSAQALLQSLIASGKLVKVINDSGQSIEFLPIPPPNGQWYFGFNSFESSEGYYIKVNGEATLTFDCSSPVSDNTAFSPVTEKFVPVFTNNPYMPMTIALTGLDIEPGDEIGVFDGDYCVGAAVVQDPSLIMVTVSMNDPYTDFTDGFTPGNMLNIKVADAYNNISVCDVEHLSGVETFVPLETFVGRISSQTTGVGQFGDMGSAVSIYPNPASDETLISYNVNSAGTIAIKLYNLSGTQVKSVDVVVEKPGRNSVKLNVNDLKSGCYILKFSFEGARDNFSTHQKLIKY